MTPALMTTVTEALAPLEQVDFDRLEKALDAMPSCAFEELLVDWWNATLALRKALGKEV